MGIDRWLNATLSIRFLECVGDKSVPSRGCSYFIFLFLFLIIWHVYHLWKTWFSATQSCCI